MPDRPAAGLARHRALIAVLLLAATARIAVIFACPSIYHPDEIFQFVEQAHRLAFGYGIIPWEFSEGMRSLLLPYLFGRLFTVVALLGGGPAAYVLAARVVLAVFSLVTVVVVYRAALRQSRTHALLASLVAATWFEIVYFSSRPLTEAIATNFLVMGLALASRPREAYSLRLCALIGFILAGCALVRIQLAPGVALIALWVMGTDVKRRLPGLLLGSLVPLAAFGIADKIAWGSYFHSYTTYITVNGLQGKAGLFGVAPIYWFGKNLVQTWSGAFPLLCVLLALAWRKFKLWVLVAALIIAVHSLIPHKEYRFVYPAYACLIIAAALGSAQIVEMIRERYGTMRGEQATGIAVLLWMATSCSLAVAPIFIHNWSSGSQLAQSFFWLYRAPQACGIELLDHSWDETGGYAYLHRNIPIYDGLTDPRVTNLPAAYNYVVLDREDARRLPAEYAVQRCFGSSQGTDICVAARPGACTDNGLPPLLAQKRLGEFSEHTRPLP
jgi:hypothetical protein